MEESSCFNIYFISRHRIMYANGFCFFVLTLLYLLEEFTDTKKNISYRSRVFDLFSKTYYKKKQSQVWKKKHKPGYLTKSVYRHTLFRFIYFVLFDSLVTLFRLRDGVRVDHINLLDPIGTQFARRDSIYSVVVFIDYPPPSANFLPTQ